MRDISDRLNYNMHAFEGGNIVFIFQFLFIHLCMD